MSEPMPSVNSVVPTMYCKGCWYILDGLESPRCSECGRPFDPRNCKSYSPLSQTASNKKRVTDTLKLFHVLAVLEIGCAFLSYYTLGEMDALVISVFLIFANILALSTLILRRRRVTIVALLLIGALVIPCQVVLGVRLVMLRIEAGQIVEYVTRKEKATGKFPKDLSGYSFVLSSNRKHIQSYSADPSKGGFMLIWYVGTPDTSHWYSPNTGWGYYPD